MIGAEGLIFAGALIAAEPLERLLAAAPYALPGSLAVGGLLAWRFRRSRALFALLVIGLVAVALPQLVRTGIVAPEEMGAGAAGTSGLIGATSAALLAAAFLVPLNLAGLTLLGERGVLTRMGALRLAAILAQTAGVIALARLEPPRVSAFASYHLIPEGLTTWTSLADPALLASLAAFLIAGTWYTLRPDPVTRGLLWAVPATFLALDAAAAGDRSSVYLAAGTLVLIVSVVESSFAMAYRDGLTGLLSRRAFNEEILKLGGHYTIAMVDIDHFKRCNDRYGHAVGDQVLRMVAMRLSAISGGGRTFRYGGEEFAVLFAGKTNAECLPHLERVRETIKGTAFTLRAADRPRHKPKKSGTARGPAKTITVTVSIGLAERSARHNEPAAVIRAADRALYRAKQRGRNRVVA